MTPGEYHDAGKCLCGHGGAGMSWMTPDALDRERWRWRRWKPQHGGWNQRLWVAVQEQWRMEVSQ